MPDTDFKRFCRAWAWKREHRPDRDRFVRPYLHTLALHAAAPAARGGCCDGGASGGGGDSSGGRTQAQPSGAAGEPRAAGAAAPQVVTLAIRQARFNAEGFAST